MAYIEVKHSYKHYTVGENTIVANHDINFTIEKGELVIILGASGAGKSTLLNILGGMDSNDEGDIFIDGTNIAHFNEKQLTHYRRHDVGFVFQFYNLIPNLSAKENVELAVEIVNNAQDPEETLKAVGLAHRINNFPAQLSGGEQQRVSIARAIAKNPKLLLCDEPTGALDYHTGKQVLKLLQYMAQHDGTTVIIVTHNSALCPIANRVIRMHDAKIKSITINEHPQDIDTLEY
ncbi:MULTISPECIES: ABC transporter ATP-binding protein [unclassified Granulicatella]|uniref:ABC transporter ATP-binding protein n=1 Tax=unclassified Granulicatella TaxID=2630493 RepID=UPI00107443F0|nr:MULTISPECIES: ABC transporter ATP-binding protein [unclassified Granulicatella]MBF0780903.1 ABC transporter ATP-binding protein [Granulicatella sp. 19428wC4_WM01]TFU93232.1 ABC transporter ATP-binding protein [Granulicatella sp. WM01]